VAAEPGGRLPLFDRMMAGVAPGWVLRRAAQRRALAALQVRMHYDAATPGNRGRSWKPNAKDADAAAAQRMRLAQVARDMIRNTPFATRAQQVIASNTVGDGIIPKVVGGDARARESLLSAVERHLDTTDIDAAGRCNLYGLQRLVVNTMVDAGEALVRFRWRLGEDGFALPFQLQVLEPDHLDVTRDGRVTNGNVVLDGIEYDLIGRRVAYWLFPQHPGATGVLWRNLESVRVPAAEVLHVFRQDRPGQNRGVSWFAPVALTLQDLGDFQDAQIMRQKIAACFAAFRVTPEAEIAGQQPIGPDGQPVAPAGLDELIPGRIQNLLPGEDMRFADPPGVEAYEEFTRATLRSAAAGLGITYEALTGDLAQVNFSSARMGRMEMNRNVSAWQWLVLVPQLLQPIGRRVVRDWQMMERREVPGLRLDWAPPAPILVDPAREIPALTAAVRSGFMSRSGAVRGLGFDPERLTAEIAADAAAADAAGLVFDSDPRRVSLSGVAQGGGLVPEDEAVGDVASSANDGGDGREDSGGGDERE
jgi:lambda family phage portal protein